MERNHSGLEDWKILFLSFHGWFVCSSRSSSRVYDLDPISFLVAKKVNYTTCHRSKGGLPGICSLVSGCQLVRTTLGSWRSRSWSTALGAGLWYSFVSGLDRIKLGGQRRGSRGYHLAPEHVVFWRGWRGGGRMMMWWKKLFGNASKQAHSEDWWVWISDVAPGNNGHDVKGQFRNQNSLKPQNVGTALKFLVRKSWHHGVFLKTCQDRPVLVFHVTTLQGMWQTGVQKSSAKITPLLKAASFRGERWHLIAFVSDGPKVKILDIYPKEGITPARDGIETINSYFRNGFGFSGWWMYLVPQRT